MTYEDIAEVVQAVWLTPLGGFHENGETTILLGPHEPGFWDHVTAHSDFCGDDPLDHWSENVISKIAKDLGASPLFPFGGPPFNPFISWALASGEAWQSAVGLIIHKEAGLMASYRGALKFPHKIELPAPAISPCETCADKPCLSACPVAAIGADGYDVPKCKAHIATDPICGAGCRVRLACPISQTYARDPRQTAFHMDAFI